MAFIADRHATYGEELQACIGKKANVYDSVIVYAV